jgi:hypothetical protein
MLAVAAKSWCVGAMAHQRQGIEMSFAQNNMGCPAETFYPAPRLDAFSSTQHTEVAPQLPPLSLSLAFTDAIKAYYNSASG